MDPQQVLQVGRRVFLEWLTGDGLERFAFYITDVKLDRLALTALTKRDETLPLSPGEIVKGYVPTPTRTYQFDAQILHHSTYPSLPLVLSMPEVLIPVQRRNFVRVQRLYQAEIAPIDAQGQVGEFLPVIGVDIAGGGVGLRIFQRRLPNSFPLQEGQIFRIRLSLPPISPGFPEGLTLEVTAKLVILIPEQNQSPYKSWGIGFSFLDIEPKQRERIVAWCFAFQRQLLRKGLWLWG